MNTKNFIKLLLLFPIFLSSCSKSQPVVINPDNVNIEYMGRMNVTNSIVKEIYWPGSSIKIKFEGTSVKALLKDEYGKNYYNIIIDSDSIRLLSLDTIKKYYTLADSLPYGKHTVEIFKRTEWDKGKTWFYGFDLGRNAEILNNEKVNNRMIEFYGNSITAGYAIQDFKGDSPDSIYTNNYLTYGALTARHFDAKYSCIAKGGIGIMLSWFPLIMPEMYNRTNPTDSASVWDFSKETPDIVVINLFQNDSWLVKKQKYVEYKHRFGNKPPPSASYIVKAYSEFVQLIRNKYPQAHIICTLGSMDITRKGSPWISYVKKAVNSMSDEKIYTHFFPYKKTSGHPEVKDHKIMAESLIKFIDEHIEW